MKILDFGLVRILGNWYRSDISHPRNSEMPTLEVLAGIEPPKPDPQEDTVKAIQKIIEVKIPPEWKFMVKKPERQQDGHQYAFRFYADIYLGNATDKPFCRIGSNFHDNIPDFVTFLKYNGEIPVRALILVKDLEKDIPEFIDAAKKHIRKH